MHSSGHGLCRARQLLVLGLLCSAELAAQEGDTAGHQGTRCCYPCRQRGHVQKDLEVFVRVVLDRFTEGSQVAWQRTHHSWHNRIPSFGALAITPDVVPTPAHAGALYTRTGREATLVASARYMAEAVRHLSAAPPRLQVDCTGRVPAIALDAIASAVLAVRRPTFLG